MLPMTMPLTTTRLRNRSRRLLPTCTALDPARPLTADAAAGGLDDRVEEIPRGLIASHQLFRMPLDADHEALFAPHLHALDDAIGRPGHLAQTVAQALDGLVVHAVHL